MNIWNKCRPSTPMDQQHSFYPRLQSRIPLSKTRSRTLTMPRRSSSSSFSRGISIRSERPTKSHHIWTPTASLLFQKPKGSSSITWATTVNSQVSSKVTSKHNSKTAWTQTPTSISWEPRCLNRPPPPLVSNPIVFRVGTLERMPMLSGRSRGIRGEGAEIGMWWVGLIKGFERCL